MTTEKLHRCKQCGFTKPLTAFPLTKEKYYRIVDEATGERRKLNKCSDCVRDYNRELKRKQREREANAREAAEKIGSNVVLIPVDDKTPISSIDQAKLVQVDGTLFRKL